jgi:hypothetical protein
MRQGHSPVTLTHQKLENGSRNARSIHHKCQQGIFHSAFGPRTDIWRGARHFKGAHAGSYIQKIRQRNKAETPLVNLIKKQHTTKKEKKNLKICALIVPFRAHPQIPTCKNIWRCCGNAKITVPSSKIAHFALVQKLVVVIDERIVA